MKTSVSLSKISPPYVTKLLPRPRLYLLLNEHRDKKIILIVGQAAQGKSTLIASYIEIETIPAAWINLEPDDSEASLRGFKFPLLILNGKKPGQPISICR